MCAKRNWTPMIRSPLSTIPLKVGRKASLKNPRKLRNLSLILNLRRGSWWFQRWVRGLDSLKLAARSLRSMTETSSVQQQLDEELWGFLLAMRADEEEEEEEGGFVPLDFSAWFLQVIYLQGLVHRHMYCWTMDADPHYRSAVQEKVPPP
jgi:hypothetical protein